MQLTRPRSAPAGPEANGHAPIGVTRAGRGPRRRLVQTGRVVLWAAILVLALSGAVRIVTDLTGTPRPVASLTGLASTADDGAFPTEAAKAFATRFTHDYLTYDAADRGRPDRLALYIPRGRDPELGWNGKGGQEVLAAVPVEVTAVRAQRAVVVVAAQVTGPRWLHLAVPVVVDDEGRIAVTDPPALVAAPARAAVPAADDPPADAALGRELTPVLESFFSAYAAGRADDLAYYLPVGRSMEGLGGVVELDELVDLRVEEGAGRRAAHAIVRWRDPETGAALTQRYELVLVDRSGRWYVDRVGAGPAPGEGNGNGGGGR